MSYAPASVCFLVVCVARPPSGSAFLQPIASSTASPFGPLLQTVAGPQADASGSARAGAPVTAARGVSPKDPGRPATGTSFPFLPLPALSRKIHSEGPPRPLPTPSSHTHHPETEKPYFLVILGRTRLPSLHPGHRRRPLRVSTPLIRPSFHGNELHQCYTHRFPGSLDLVHTSGLTWPSYNSFMQAEWIRTPRTASFR